MLQPARLFWIDLRRCPSYPWWEEQPACWVACSVDPWCWGVALPRFDTPSTFHAVQYRESPRSRFARWLSNFTEPQLTWPIAENIFCCFCKVWDKSLNVGSHVVCKLSAPNSWKDNARNSWKDNSLNSWYLLLFDKKYQDFLDSNFSFWTSVGECEWKWVTVSLHECEWARFIYVLSIYSFAILCWD